MLAKSSGVAQTFQNVMESYPDSGKIKILPFKEIDHSLVMKQYLESNKRIKEILDVSNQLRIIMLIDLGYPFGNIHY